MHPLSQRTIPRYRQLRSHLQKVQNLQKYSAVVSITKSQSVLQLFHTSLPSPFPLSTKPGNDVMVTPCERNRNTVCRCQDGYYKYNIDSEAYECLRCKTCDLNEKEIQKCEPRKETQSAQRVAKGRWSSNLSLCYCSFQVHQRKTPRVRVKTTTTEAATTSVKSAASAYTHFYR